MADTAPDLSVGSDEGEAGANGDNPETSGANVVAEMVTIQESTIAELRGNFPDVPLSPGVDLAAIKANDPDATFLTIQIAEVGRTGIGKYLFDGMAVPLLYDEYLVGEIQRQIAEMRPGAAMGHPDKHSMDTSYPEPKAFWVGSMRVGPVLWGKAYIRDAGTAKLIRDTKSVNGKIATSILGEGALGLMPDRKAVHILPDPGYDLNRIDFAPPKKASLRLNSDYAVTAEMTDESSNDLSEHNEGNSMPTKEEIKAALAGLSPKEVRELLGETVQPIAELVAAEQGNRIVPVAIAEMGTTRDTEARALKTENDAQKQTIAELQGENETFKTQQFAVGLEGLVEGATDWKNLKTEKDKVRVASFRKQLTNAVIAELKGAKDLARAKVIIAEQMAGDLSPLAESVLFSISGGNTITRNSDVSDVRTSSLDEAQALLAEHGFSRAPVKSEV